MEVDDGTSRRRLHTPMKLDDPWRIPWVARPYLHWNLVCVGAIATCLILDDSWLWRLMMEHLNVKILINKLSNSDEKITPTFHTFITEEITEIELLNSVINMMAILHLVYTENINCLTIK